MKQLKIISSQFLLLLLAAGLFVACDRDCGGKPVTIDSFALFQYEFKNEAWGHQHEGWFIDVEGVIGHYELPSVWIEPDSMGFLTEEELDLNMAKADEIIGNVNNADLNTYSELLNQVNPFDLSSFEVVGADGGDGYLYGYQWKPSSGRFHRVLLARGIDYHQRNLDPEAVEITEWLIDIGHRIDPYFGF